MIRINVSLTDIGRFAGMDGIFARYAVAPHPTRNTIGVYFLWGGGQVGIDVRAIQPGSRADDGPPT